MPITEAARKAGPYVATGGQTIFPYGFPILAATELQVYHNATLLTLDVHYTVTGIGGDGGNVVLLTGATVNDKVVIWGTTADSQGTDYVEHDAFPAEAHEEALDRRTRISQELRARISRAPLLPPWSTLGSLTLPDPSSLVTTQGGKKALIYNDAGTDLTMIELVSQIGIVGDVIPEVANVGSLPAAGTAGRLRAIADSDQFALDSGVAWILFTPGNELIAPSTTRAALGSPAGLNTGKARYLTDAPTALTVSDGTAWQEFPVGGIGALAGSTFAGLGSLTPAGQMVRLTNMNLGLAMTNGTVWHAVDAPTWRPERFVNAIGTLNAALTAALAAMPAMGGTIDLRSYTGHWEMNATVVINKPCRILFGEVTITSGVSPMFQITAAGPVVFEGVSRESTRLRSTAANQIVVKVDTAQRCMFRTLTIDHSGPGRTGGAGIQVNGGGGVSNGFSCFTHMDIVDQWIGIDTQAAHGWTLYDCYIVNYWSIGVHVANIVTPDAGDSTIYGCVFDTSHADVNNAAIFQHHSGGLRIHNNKILAGYYGIIVDITETTVILEIIGNSIENQAGTSIGLGRTSGTATFSNAIILGNQISNANNACLAITSIGIAFVLIANNIMGFLSPQAGISLTAVNGAMIQGNVLSANGGTSIGISVGAAAEGVDVGRNGYHSVTTQVSYQATVAYTSDRAVGMTTAQRDTIVHEQGLYERIFNVTTGKHQAWTGAAWVDLH